MSPLPVIIAFGFVNPLMLGWLAAVAAPILIHYWSRRRYRETSWAAMEFLLAAVRRHARRIFFEQWLLLAIRIAVIVLLVLAAAGIYGGLPGATLAGKGATHCVLVIDGSYSMGVKPGEQNCFERAKQLAEQIVKQGPPGDAYTLLLMSSPTQTVIGKPTFEPAQILRKIEGLQITQTTADLPGTVATIEQLLDATQEDNPRLVQHEIYFLTDMQRVTWFPRLAKTALDEFRRSSTRLGERAAIQIIDVGPETAENLAVTALGLSDPIVITGREANLRTAIKNFGRQARTNQAVELLIDGRRVEERFIDIPAGEEIFLDFAYRFETLGEHSVEIRALGDALDVDNHRFMTVKAREEIRVLCIDGRPSGKRFGGAADYLAAALAAQANEAEPAVIRPEVAPESALSERELTSYDCVFLCNVAQFTKQEVDLLRNYLQNGGNAVFFLGDQVLAERYNQELAGGTANQESGRAGEGRILPARLAEVVDQGQAGLDPLDFRHPILQVFRGRGEKGLLTTPVFKYFKLQVPKDSRAQVVLKTAEGDPLLVEESIGRGTVVLAATSADSSWTALPLWPSFVPLVHEILAFCLSGEEKQHNLNIDPAESDLTKVSLDQLQNEVCPGVRFFTQAAGRNIGRWAVSSSLGHGGLQLDLQYALMGLLFLETFLAWLFGHHSR